MGEFSPETLPKAIQKGIWWAMASFAVLLVCILGVQLSSLHSTVVLGDIRWGYLFIGWCTMCSALVALGFRWAVLIPDIDAEPLFFSACLCSALLLNYAIPGPFGELAAAWFIHKRYSISVVKALVAGTAARLIGLASAALGVLVLWGGVELRAELADWIKPVVYGVGGGLGLLMFLMVLPSSWREKLKQRGEDSKVFSLLYQFADAFVMLRVPKALFWSGMWSFIGHILAFGGVWISIYAVYGPQQVTGVGFSYFMGTCIGAVAFLFPGSQLSWDASLAMLLYASTALEPSDATVMTVVLRMEQLAMMMLGAIAVVWVQSRISRSE